MSSDDCPGAPAPPFPTNSPPTMDLAVDQRPSPHHKISPRQPRTSLPRAVHCPLCHRALEAVSRAESAEVFCTACGCAFELPQPEPPGHVVKASVDDPNEKDGLDCWLAGNPIRARELSDWERLRQWSRQRPVTARVAATSGFATILVAIVSTALLIAATTARRHTELALTELQQKHATTLLELQSTEKLVRHHKQESQQAAKTCQTTLAKLRDTEEDLEELQQHHDALAQGQEEIAAKARLELARQMASESARSLTTQPAQSLLLAERAMTYLAEHDERTDPLLQQTLRDAAALTGDQTLRGHSGPVEAIAVSQNGRWLLSASVDMTARLWDLHGTPDDESRVLRGHQAPVRLARISPDSSWAATADDNGQVIVWNLEASPPDSFWTLHAHRGRINDLTVSADSRWLAVGGTGAFEDEDNTVRLWDIKAIARSEDAQQSDADGGASDQMQQPSVLRGHLGPVLAVAITPDCRWVVTASQDKTVRLFDLTSHCPAASQVVLRGHAGPVVSIAISPDGRWMVTGSHDRAVRLWDLTTPQPGSRTTVLNGHEGGVHSVAISSTGHWVASAAHDHTVRLWNMNAVDPAATCITLNGMAGEVGPILFSADGRMLIAGGDGGTACVWDVESATDSASPILLNGHCGPIAALAVTPDGRKVLTGCRETSNRTDCLIRVWDLPIDDVLRKARPVIAQRINAAEQEQILLQTAGRQDQEYHKNTKVQ